MKVTLYMKMYPIGCIIIRYDFGPVILYVMLNMLIVIREESEVIVWKVVIGNVVKSNDCVKFMSIYICKLRLFGKYILIVNLTQSKSQDRQLQVALSGKYEGSGHYVPHAD